MGAEAKNQEAVSGTDRALALRLGLCLFVFYVGFAPGSFKSSDEWTVFEAAVSLADTGRPTVGEAPYTHRGRDGRRYSQYALGQSVIAMPFVWTGRVAKRVLPESWSAAIAGRKMPIKGPARAGGTPEIAFVTLISPLVLALLGVAGFALQRQLGVSRGHALVAAALVGTTTYVAAQATFFLRHGTTTLLLFLALLGFQRFRASGRPASLLAGASAAACIPLVRLPDAILGLPLGLFVAWVLVEAWRRAGGAALRRAVPALLVPVLVAAAAQLASNQILWGSWAGSPILDYSAEFGFPILAGLRGFLLSPGGSVFAYSPLLLVAPWAASALARRDRALFAFCAGTSLWLLLFYSKWEYWPGLPTAPGPRYLYAAVPLLLVSLGPWLDDRRGRVPWRVLGVLALVGGVVQLGLLLADWHMIIHELQVAGAKPPWDWMLVPEKSPIRGAWLAISSGELNPWLWRLGEGWRGFEPRPGWASALTALWLATLAVCIRGLVRRTRAEPSGSG